MTHAKDASKHIVLLIRVYQVVYNWQLVIAISLPLSGWCAACLHAVVCDIARPGELVAASGHVAVNNACGLV